jgi:hypothetical protein
MAKTSWRTAVLCGACLPGLVGCSVTPTYEVRVVNESTMTVDATIMNTRNLARHEALARVRLAPNTEAVLGPVEAPPLDPVELQVARPEDMGVMARRHKLGRGTWQATVAGSGVESWEPISVTVTRE